jgi:alkanesulfonate monooxygenase SsuD/methylene tetrahydromethanopterin reductase-like flavin-dependent oxidoreductase (luciferase family)
VVLDLRNRPDRLREVARMCDGAGIDSLWTRDPPPSPEEPVLEAWTALTLAAQETRHPTVGASLDVARREPGSVAAMASTLDAASGGRLELTFLYSRARDASEAGPGVQPELETFVATVRRLLEREAVAVSEPVERGAGGRRDDLGLPRLAIEAMDDASIEVAVRLADDVAIPPGSGPDAVAVVARCRAACERAGRDPATMGVALVAPVSIGRTTAEAQARADAEALFHTIGRPSEVGVFGTLEQCQERVISLAHAGVTDLRCILPNSADVHDVIAQLTAMTVGSVDVLSPGAPRSRAPDPPATWGGRAPRDAT